MTIKEAIKIADNADFDRFFINVDDGYIKITQIYYSPDSNSGGQWIELLYDENLVIEAASHCKDSDTFFDYIEARANEYLHDITNEKDFVEMSEFYDGAYDFEGLSGKIMYELIALCYKN